MPQVACLIDRVPALLQWTRALAEEAEGSLRRRELPATRHACQVFLARCNELLEAATRLCGREAGWMFPSYDLCRVPADSIPSMDLGSYLDHAATTLRQLIFFLEHRLTSDRQQ